MYMGDLYATPVMIRREMIIVRRKPDPCYNRGG